MLLSDVRMNSISAIILIGRFCSHPSSIRSSTLNIMPMAYVCRLMFVCVIYVQAGKAAYVYVHMCVCLCVSNVHRLGGRY